MRYKNKDGKIVVHFLNKEQVEELYRFAVLAKTFTDIKEQDVQESYW